MFDVRSSSAGQYVSIVTTSEAGFIYTRGTRFIIGVQILWALDYNNCTLYLNRLHRLKNKSWITKILDQSKTFKKTCPRFKEALKNAKFCV
ncbi:hypothetical protein GDO81_023281 [Engystomops pustulosus]|uniref:Uncharacterized protein n=1 Tax=Engystomops pustulosus TaxID=76066 RepID=A0AAV6ZI56_ENGPU|nr:hypothetical protein GDO81_023281 [Engystomops pustulosus]